MNTQTEWQPVALVPASRSNDTMTTVEVACTHEDVYLASFNRDGDSADTRMTPDEARHLAAALIAAADRAADVVA